MNIGIFSGSFNPIHQGHLMIANYVVEYTSIDRVWFMVSPQNPLKNSSELIDQYERLAMVETAVQGYDRFQASDFEFHLPKPTYTIDTLQALTTTYPEHTFSLIIGADNWTLFEKWKSYEEIIQNYSVYVYNRPKYTIHIPEKYASSVQQLDSPLIEISSTFIRQGIRESRNLKSFLPPKVWDYLIKNKLYER